uniref:Uncharacterized protein n=1 Tax=Vespula pensylvanica TaxID=30213 RepID=A0A834PCD9_VESPE|nr:hypothetical protein H0235_003697 [Vespula pensylvanica]
MNGSGYSSRFSRNVLENNRRILPSVGDTEPESSRRNIIKALLANLPQNPVCRLIVFPDPPLPQSRRISPRDIRYARRDATTINQFVSQPYSNRNAFIIHA